MDLDGVLPTPRWLRLPVAEQSISDVAHRLAVGEVAKQHRDLMRPATNVFLVFIGGPISNNLFKGVAIKKGK